ncbi:hypothetical protein SFUMM280S_07826 [Streptomyces fumanus]
MANGVVFAVIFTGPSSGASVFGFASPSSSSFCFSLPPGAAPADAAVSFLPSRAVAVAAACHGPDDADEHEQGDDAEAAQADDLPGAVLLRRLRLRRLLRVLLVHLRPPRVRTGDAAA